MWRAFSISFISVFGSTILWLLWETIFSFRGDNTKNQRILADFHAIKAALATYKLKAGHYPSTEQGLMVLVETPHSGPLPEEWEKLAERVPIDPWGAEYRYLLHGTNDPSGIELRSAGPDGIHCTEDDFSSSD